MSRMVSGFRTRFLSALCCSVLLALAACGDDGSSPGNGLLRDAGSRDSGVHDAFVRMDAGAIPDASPDAGSSNGETCAVGEDDRIRIDDVGGKGFALAAATQEQLLVYPAPGDCVDALWVQRIPVSGLIEEPRKLEVSDVCSRVRDPSLLRVDDRWLLVWSDNRSGSTELHGVKLDANAHATGRPVRLSETAGADGVPVLAAGGAAATTLAWIEADAQADARRVWMRPLAADATAAGEAEELTAASQAAPGALALRRVTDDALALAWLGDEDISLQAVGASDGVRGEMRTLADSSGSSVGFARRDDAAAAVYAIRAGGAPSSVRLRFLTPNGLPEAGEIRLAGPTPAAGPAAIEALGQGYAVALRQQRPEGGSRIRVLFVDVVGAVVGDHDLADGGSGTGPLQLDVTPDGRMVIAFTHTDESGGQSLRVIRVRCAT